MYEISTSDKSKMSEEVCRYLDIFLDMRIKWYRILSTTESNDDEYPRLIGQEIDSVISRGVA